MAKKLFLERNVEILKNNSETTKGDILRLIDLISYLTVNKELSLTDAENYVYRLFKLMEEARAS